MKNLLLLLFSSYCTSVIAQNTTIRGKIINPTSDSCSLMVMIPVPNSFYFSTKDLGGVPLNEDGTFILKVDLDSSVSTMFQVCNEVTTVLLDPGDDIHVTLNSKLFDETVSYTGKGAEKNNQVARLTLMSESASANMPDFKTISDTSKMRTAVYDAYGNFKQVLLDHVAHQLPGYAFAQSELEQMEMRIDYEIKRFVKKKRIQEANAGKKLTFIGEDIMGKKVKSSSFKGKVTVLDFWASWCGPCKAEMPDLKKLEKEFGTKVNFVGVGVWDKLEDWKHATTELELHNSIYIDKEGCEQFKSLEMTSIPRYVVLDEDGIVIDPNAPRPSSGELQKYF